MYLFSLIVIYEQSSCKAFFREKYDHLFHPRFYCRNIYVVGDWLYANINRIIWLR